MPDVREIDTNLGLRITIETIKDGYSVSIDQILTDDVGHLTGEAEIFPSKKAAKREQARCMIRDIIDPTNNEYQSANIYQHIMECSIDIPDDILERMLSEERARRKKDVTWQKEQLSYATKRLAAFEKLTKGKR